MNTDIACQHDKKNMYEEFFHVQKDDAEIREYLCQHTLPNIYYEQTCATCTINDMRRKNELSAITKFDLKSNSCVEWLMGNTRQRYCWKSNNPEIKIIKCEYPDCIYAVMFHLDDQKEHGLCVKHYNLYKKCPDCVFNPIPKCEICFKYFKHVNEFNENYADVPCITYGLNLHHETRKFDTHQNQYAFTFEYYSEEKENDMLIDGTHYPIYGCLELCNKMNAWCEKCNRCIGNSSVIGACNIDIFPHCDKCGKHSAFRHCEICGIHSSFEHDYTAKFPHHYCDDCDTHDFPHCKICNKHCKFRCENEREELLEKKYIS